MPRVSKKSSVFAIIGIIGRLHDVEGHAYLMQPVARNLWATTAFQTWAHEGLNYCPHCFQSRGPAQVRARAERLTSPEDLLLYGNGEWPHYSSFERNELLANGNYLETEAISVRHGICGDPEQMDCGWAPVLHHSDRTTFHRSFEPALLKSGYKTSVNLCQTQPETSNRYGQANDNYPVLESYEEGTVIEMKIVMSTYHWGHLEFFICNTEDLGSGDPEGSVVTQSCFNMHPLDRASDDDTASPIDPAYKGRYYVDPSCRAAEPETDQTKVEGATDGDVVTARYQLPDGLTCSRCIIQMVYYTGNACRHPGYDTFDGPDVWPSACAPSKDDWITTSVGMCGMDGNYPEEFWNCADIEIIKAGGSPTVSAPSPDAGVEAETVAPVDTPTEGPPPQTEAWVSPPAIENPTPAPAPAPMEESPGTPAPDVGGGEESTNDCGEVVESLEQCGGDESYTGPVCCVDGHTCESVADDYAECRPIEGGCSDDWRQCGGLGWNGPTCCWAGTECKGDQWYAQCIPDRAF